MKVPKCESEHWEHSVRRTTDVGALCHTLNVSRSTLYSYVGPQGEVRRSPER